MPSFFFVIQAEHCRHSHRYHAHSEINDNFLTDQVGEMATPTSVFLCEMILIKPNCFTPSAFILLLLLRYTGRTLHRHSHRYHAHSEINDNFLTDQVEEMATPTSVFLCEMILIKPKCFML